MPAINVQVTGDTTLVQVTGKFTVADIYRIEENFYEGKPTRFMIWDFTRAPDISYNDQSAQLIAQLISHYPDKRKAGRTAIIAPLGHYYDMGRHFCELVRARRLPLEVEVFDTHEQASQWLQRPPASED